MHSGSQKSGGSNLSKALPKKEKVRTNLLSRLLFMMQGDTFERQNSKGKGWSELSRSKLRCAAFESCWWLAQSIMDDAKCQQCKSLVR